MQDLMLLLRLMPFSLGIDTITAIANSGTTEPMDTTMGRGLEMLALMLMPSSLDTDTTMVTMDIMDTTGPMDTTTGRDLLTLVLKLMLMLKLVPSSWDLVTITEGFITIWAIMDTTMAMATTGANLA